MVSNFKLLKKFLDLPYLSLSKQDFLKEFYCLLFKLCECDFLEIWISSKDKLIKIDNSSINYIKISKKKKKYL